MDFFFHKIVISYQGVCFSFPDYKSLVALSLSNEDKNNNALPQDYAAHTTQNLNRDQ